MKRAEQHHKLSNCREHCSAYNQGCKMNTILLGCCKMNTILLGGCKMNTILLGGCKMNIILLGCSMPLYAC